MLGRPRTGLLQRQLDTSLTMLSAHFESCGYTAVSPPHLYLGETLLSLYGEDLRARAFLFPDAERGNELCLRPDFTVPVALIHGENGWDTAGAYAYQGPVFRRQQPGLGRPVEYIQAGIESFGEADTTAADTLALTTLIGGLRALGLHEVEMTIGDLSVPFALLDSLEMPDRRRADLRRHFWRPSRFQDLVKRSVMPPSDSAARIELLEAVAPGAAPDGLSNRARAEGEFIGLRRLDEIQQRAVSLSLAKADPPMEQSAADLIDAMLAIAGPAVQAGTRMRALAGEIGGALAKAVDRFDQRLEALSKQGVDPAQLQFDSSFGRNLEYYDGFVFEIRANGQQAHPPIAGGGRYDSMTAKLGATHPVPAVGGMIRPEAVLSALT